MENLTKNYITYKHSYHLVNPSPWPIFTSFAALVLTSGVVLYMHSYKNGGLLAILGFVLILFSVTC
jgi:cytochrome c oxidase subunit 3